MTNEPIGLPRGTVRAYLALMIVAAFLVTHAVAAGWLLYLGNMEAALAVLGAPALEAGTVSGFYFASRPQGES